MDVEARVQAEICMYPSVVWVASRRHSSRRNSSVHQSVALCAAGSERVAAEQPKDMTHAAVAFVLGARVKWWPLCQSHVLCGGGRAPLLLPRNSLLFLLA